MRVFSGRDSGRCFLLILHKKTGMPLFTAKTSERKISAMKEAVPLKKDNKNYSDACYRVGNYFYLFDYVYMKTMEATVRAKIRR